MTISGDPTCPLVSCALVTALVSRSSPSRGSAGARPGLRGRRRRHSRKKTSATAACGDGLLATGETCESCPADCQPSTCKTKERRKVTDRSHATERLRQGRRRHRPFVGYRKGGAEPAGREGCAGRTSARQGRVIRSRRRCSSTISVTRCASWLSSSDGMPARPLLDIDLDVCAGAPAAQVGRSELSRRVMCAGGRQTDRSASAASACPEGSGKEGEMANGWQKKGNRA